MRAGCDALAGGETGRRACRVKYSSATERPGAPWLGSAAREAFSTVSAYDRQGARAELAAAQQHDNASSAFHDRRICFPGRRPWMAEGWVAEL